jgi:tripartite-type tricarboxylate transporter receptor subunit TctC
MHRRLITHLASLIGIALLATAHPAWAQQYPTKAIRMIVGQPAGGGTDLIARVVADKLRDAFKQPIIIDNRPGAGNMLASKLVAEAPADGYTLVVQGMSSTVTPSLYRSVPYNPLDLQGVAPLMSFPFVIVVNPKLPVATLKDFSDYLKTNGAKLNVASAGGTTTVTAELYSQMIGAKLRYIPYNGSAPALLSVIGGENQVMFSDLPSAFQHVKSGALRGIATSGAKRSQQAPEIPTVKELGMPDFVVLSWYGLFAPIRTPATVVNLLNETVKTAVLQPDSVTRLAGMGGEPFTDTVKGFSDLYHADLIRWKRVIQQGNMPLID